MPTVPGNVPGQGDGNTPVMGGDRGQLLDDLHNSPTILPDRTLTMLRAPEALAAGGRGEAVLVQQVIELGRQNGLTIDPDEALRFVRLMAANFTDERSTMPPGPPGPMRANGPPMAPMTMQAQAWMLATRMNPNPGESVSPEQRTAMMDAFLGQLGQLAGEVRQSHVLQRATPAEAPDYHDPNVREVLRQMQGSGWVLTPQIDQLARFTLPYAQQHGFTGTRNQLYMILHTVGREVSETGIMNPARIAEITGFPIGHPFHDFVTDLSLRMHQAIYQIPVAPGPGGPPPGLQPGVIPVPGGQGGGMLPGGPPPVNGGQWGGPPPVEWNRPVQPVPGPGNENGIPNGIRARAPGNQPGGDGDQPGGGAGNQPGGGAGNQPGSSAGNQPGGGAGNQPGGGAGNLPGGGAGNRPGGGAGNQPGGGAGNQPGGGAGNQPGGGAGNQPGGGGGNQPGEGGGNQPGGGPVQPGGARLQPGGGGFQPRPLPPPGQSPEAPEGAVPVQPHRVATIEELEARLREVGVLLATIKDRDERMFRIFANPEYADVSVELLNDILRDNEHLITSAHHGQELRRLVMQAEYDEDMRILQVQREAVETFTCGWDCGTPERLLARVNELPWRERLALREAYEQGNTPVVNAILLRSLLRDPENGARVAQFLMHLSPDELCELQAEFSNRYGSTIDQFITDNPGSVDDRHRRLCIICCSADPDAVAEERVIVALGLRGGPVDVQTINDLLGEMTPERRTEVLASARAIARAQPWDTDVASGQLMAAGGDHLLAVLTRQAGGLPGARITLSLFGTGPGQGPMDPERLAAYRAAVDSGYVGPDGCAVLVRRIRAQSDPVADMRSIRERLGEAGWNELLRLYQEQTGRPLLADILGPNPSAARVESMRASGLFTNQQLRAYTDYVVATHALITAQTSADCDALWAQRREKYDLQHRNRLEILRLLRENGQYTGAPDTDERVAQSPEYWRVVGRALGPETGDPAVIITRLQTLCQQNGNEPTNSRVRNWQTISGLVAQEGDIDQQIERLNVQVRGIEQQRLMIRNDMLASHYPLLREFGYVTGPENPVFTAGNRPAGVMFTQRFEDALAEGRRDYRLLLTEIEARSSRGMADPVYRQLVEQQRGIEWMTLQRRILVLADSGQELKAKEILQAWVNLPSSSDSPYIAQARLQLSRMPNGEWRSIANDSAMVPPTTGQTLALRFGVNQTPPEWDAAPGHLRRGCETVTERQLVNDLRGALATQPYGNARTAIQAWVDAGNGNPQIAAVLARRPPLEGEALIDALAQTKATPDECARFAAQLRLITLLANPANNSPTSIYLTANVNDPLYDVYEQWMTDRRDLPRDANYYLVFSLHPDEAQALVAHLEAATRAREVSDLLVEMSPEDRAEALRLYEQVTGRSLASDLFAQRPLGDANGAYLGYVFHLDILPRDAWRVYFPTGDLPTTFDQFLDYFEEEMELDSRIISEFLRDNSAAFEQYGRERGELMVAIDTAIRTGRHEEAADLQRRLNELDTTFRRSMQVHYAELNEDSPGLPERLNVLALAQSAATDQQRATAYRITSQTQSWSASANDVVALLRANRTTEAMDLVRGLNLSPVEMEIFALLYRESLAAQQRATDPAARPPAWMTGGIVRDLQGNPPANRELAEALFARPSGSRGQFSEYDERRLRALLTDTTPGAQERAVAYLAIMGDPARVRDAVDRLAAAGVVIPTAWTNVQAFVQAVRDNNQPVVQAIALQSFLNRQPPPTADQIAERFAVISRNGDLPAIIAAYNARFGSDGTDRLLADLNRVAPGHQALWQRLMAAANDRVAVATVLADHALRIRETSNPSAPNYHLFQLAVQVAPPEQRAALRARLDAVVAQVYAGQTLRNPTNNQVLALTLESLLIARGGGFGVGDASLVTRILQSPDLSRQQIDQFLAVRESLRSQVQSLERSRAEIQTQINQWRRDEESFRNQRIDAQREYDNGRYDFLRWVCGGHAALRDRIHHLRGMEDNARRIRQELEGGAARIDQTIRDVRGWGNYSLTQVANGNNFGATHGMQTVQSTTQNLNTYLTQMSTRIEHLQRRLQLHYEGYQQAMRDWERYQTIRTVVEIAAVIVVGAFNPLAAVALATAFAVVRHGQDYLNGKITLGQFFLRVGFEAGLAILGGAGSRLLGPLTRIRLPMWNVSAINRGTGQVLANVSVFGRHLSDPQKLNAALRVAALIPANTPAFIQITQATGRIFIPLGWGGTFAGNVLFGPNTPQLSLPRMPAITLPVAMPMPTINARPNPADDGAARPPAGIPRAELVAASRGAAPAGGTTGDGGSGRPGSLPSFRDLGISSPSRYAPIMRRVMMPEGGGAPVVTDLVGEGKVKERRRPPKPPPVARGRSLSRHDDDEGSSDTPGAPEDLSVDPPDHDSAEFEADHDPGIVSPGTEIISGGLGVMVTGVEIASGDGAPVLQYHVVRFDPRDPTVPPDASGGPPSKDPPPASPGGAPPKDPPVSGAAPKDDPKSAPDGAPKKDGPKDPPGDAPKEDSPPDKRTSRTRRTDRRDDADTDGRRPGTGDDRPPFEPPEEKEKREERKKKKSKPRKRAAKPERTVPTVKVVLPPAPSENTTPPVDTAKKDGAAVMGPSLANDVPSLGNSYTRSAQNQEAAKTASVDLVDTALPSVDLDELRNETASAERSAERDAHAGETMVAVAAMVEADKHLRHEISGELTSIRNDLSAISVEHGSPTEVKSAIDLIESANRSLMRTVELPTLAERMSADTAVREQVLRAQELVVSAAVASPLAAPVLAGTHDRLSEVSLTLKHQEILDRLDRLESHLTESPSRELAAIPAEYLEQIREDIFLREGVSTEVSAEIDVFATLSEARDVVEAVPEAVAATSEVELPMVALEIGQISADLAAHDIATELDAAIRAVREIEIPEEARLVVDELTELRARLAEMIHEGLHAGVEEEIAALTAEIIEKLEILAEVEGMPADAVAVFEESIEQIEASMAEMEQAFHPAARPVEDVAREVGALAETLSELALPEEVAPAAEQAVELLEAAQAALAAGESVDLTSRLEAAESLAEAARLLESIAESEAVGEAERESLAPLVEKLRELSEDLARTEVEAVAAAVEAPLDVEGIATTLAGAARSLETLEIEGALKPAVIAALDEIEEACERLAAGTEYGPAEREELSAAVSEAARIVEEMLQSEALGEEERAALETIAETLTEVAEAIAPPTGKPVADATVEPVHGASLVRELARDLAEREVVLEGLEVEAMRQPAVYAAVEEMRTVSELLENGPPSTAEEMAEVRESLARAGEAVEGILESELLSETERAELDELLETITALGESIHTAPTPQPAAPLLPETAVELRTLAPALDRIRIEPAAQPAVSAAASTVEDLALAIEEGRVDDTRILARAAETALGEVLESPSLTQEERRAVEELREAVAVVAGDGERVGTEVRPAPAPVRGAELPDPAVVSTARDLLSDVEVPPASTPALLGARAALDEAVEALSEDGPGAREPGERASAALARAAEIVEALLESDLAPAARASLEAVRDTLAPVTRSAEPEAPALEPAIAVRDDGATHRPVTAALEREMEAILPSDTRAVVTDLLSKLAPRASEGSVVTEAPAIDAVLDVVKRLGEALIPGGREPTPEEVELTREIQRHAARAAAILLAESLERERERAAIRPLRLVKANEQDVDRVLEETQRLLWSLVREERGRTAASSKAPNGGGVAAHLEGLVRIAAAHSPTCEAVVRSGALRDVLDPLAAAARRARIPSILAKDEDGGRGRVTKRRAPDSASSRRARIALPPQPPSHAVTYPSLEHRILVTASKARPPGGRRALKKSISKGPIGPDDAPKR